MARRRRAERKKVKLRLAIMGASGSGKTFSALRIATGLVGGRTGDAPPKIIMIDTENGSGELYSGDFDYDYEEITPPYTAKKIIDLIKDVEGDYDIIIVDSLTHFWAKAGGILELKDNKLKTGKFKNEFTVWGDLTPIQNSIIDAILQSKAHIICTMRSKTEYTVEIKEIRGEKKAVPKAIGLAPEQRPGIEYEFMITFDVSKEDHFAYALKDRSRLFDDKSFIITEETGKEILTWLESGAEPTPAAASVREKPSAAKLEFFRRYKEYGEDPKDRDALTAFVLDFVGKDPFAETLTDDDYKKLIRQISTLEKEADSPLSESDIDPARVGDEPL
ncbi:MAG TPA: AAA family ATPase [Clostridia bacterium]|nr:AAA family ATPase [Clostridia bacterium]